MRRDWEGIEKEFGMKLGKGLGNLGRDMRGILKGLGRDLKGIRKGLGKGLGKD